MYVTICDKMMTMYVTISDKMTWQCMLQYVIRLYENVFYNKW